MSIELAPRVREGRAPYVLIGLLLLHLALLSLQIEDPAGGKLLKRWILAAGTPFLSGASSISTGAKSLWTEYVWLSGARKENLRLHETVREMRLRERATAEMQEENIRLRRLLGLADVPGWEPAAARVVARTPDYLANVLYVNRGSDDGVGVDAPVLSAAGILGRTVLVTAGSAQVQLITNADASVGVLIDRTRSPGVLRGTGNPWMSLEYISNTEQVLPGDVVVTSGLDGIFPKGLPVGKVVESRKGKTVFLDLRVDPSADLLRIEEVLILRAPGGRRDETPTPEDGAPGSLPD